MIKDLGIYSGAKGGFLFTVCLPQYLYFIDRCRNIARVDYYDIRFSAANYTIPCKREYIIKKGYALLALGFIGLCIAVLGAKGIDASHVGLLFALLALMSLTFGTIKQKGINMNIESMVVYQNLFTLLLFSVVALCTDWQVEWTNELFISLFWMSIVVSVGAVMLLLYMLKRGSASQVSVLFYCIPLWPLCLII